MTPRPVRSLALKVSFSILSCLAVSPASADPLYNIVNLGTLPGTTQSIATGINASGQVTGVSYNAGNAWTSAQTQGVLAPLNVSYGDGAESFLYSGGQTTQINPVNGPANAINDSGQVVGGAYSSINDAGQYVGSSGSALVYEGQYNVQGQLVSGGIATIIEMTPLAISNSGEIVGSSGTFNIGAFSYLNGQLTNLSTEFHLNDKSDAAFAISNSGYILIAEGEMGGANPIHYVLINPTGYTFNGVTSPTATDLTNLAGGSGTIATAVNDLGQVVGNGFLYSDGQFTSLQSLLPPLSSGSWSNLVATGINDAGQIVGQGTYDGQQVAFLMTPDAVETPEPSTIFMFAAGLSAICAAKWRTRLRGGDPSTRA